MRRAAFTILLLSSSTLSAMALDIPPQGTLDGPVRTIAYSEATRVMLVLDVGLMTNITFGTDERIKRVLIGRENGPIAVPDPEKELKNVPLVNNLPVRGIEVGSTNLIVHTLMPDNITERVYQFWIRVKPTPPDGAEDKEATYGLKIIYPQQEKQIAQQKAAVNWKTQQAAKQREVAEARLATDVFYGTRNYRYLGQGDTSISPYEASDNGRLTAFRYPGNTTIPAIYIVDSPAWCPDDIRKLPPKSYLTAAERTAQTVAKDDMLVVQQTAEHFRVRLGPHVAEVYNCGFSPVGQEPGTGTTSPDVYRRTLSVK